VFEIGLAGHWTTYSATSIEPDVAGSVAGVGEREAVRPPVPSAKPGAAGTVVSLDRGADYFRSQITEVNVAESTVATTLRPLLEHIDHDRDHWVASDDRMQTFWRASYLGNGQFKLTGPPVSRQAFGPEGVLRVWECGVGDEARQRTSVALRRVAREDYELTTDVPVTVALRGSGLEVRAGSQPLAVKIARSADGWLNLDLPASAEPYRIRANP
jgi:hypothetical protein